MNLKYLRPIAPLLLLVAACTDTPSLHTGGGDTPNSDSLRALIVSEGQYGFGTGSLTSLYKGGSVFQDVFRSKNSRPLGDVPQSVTRIGNNFYVPVNNSRKVEVMDARTFESVETMVIPENAIPMYALHLGGDSMVVSDQSSLAIPGSGLHSSLLIMDLNHGTQREVVRRLIPMDFPTFQMTLVGNKLFVGGAKLSVFDLDNLTQEGCRFIATPTGETIQVSDHAKLCRDSQNRLWVLSAQGVVCVDPSSERVVEVVSLEGISTLWGNLDIDFEGRYLYFNVGCDVYRIDTQNPTMPTAPLFTHSAHDAAWTTYTLAVTRENTLLLSRALYGSVSRGRIFEYSPQGEIVHRYPEKEGVLQDYFQAGIFPHCIYIP